MLWDLYTLLACIFITTLVCKRGRAVHRKFLANLLAAAVAGQIFDMPALGFIQKI